MTEPSAPEFWRLTVEAQKQRKRAEDLAHLNTVLLDQLRGIRDHAEALTQPGMTPSFSKTAISHFKQLQAAADRALAYAALKQRPGG